MPTRCESSSSCRTITYIQIRIDSVLVAVVSRTRVRLESRPSRLLRRRLGTCTGSSDETPLL